MALIRIDDLKKHYMSGNETVEALRGVDLAIKVGEFVTIMGQSGSGKSTLLSVLGGMNHPTAGTVEMAGENSMSSPANGSPTFGLGTSGSSSSRSISSSTSLPWRTSCSPWPSSE